MASRTADTAGHARTTETNQTAQQVPACAVIRPRAGLSYAGKQDLAYFEGVSAQSAGSTGLCMHLLQVPPGAQSKAHLHEHHETAVYVLSGQAEMLYGEGLRERLTAGAGDFVYIPAGVPHVVRNLSQTEPATGVIARTDPNEQESVLLLPELEKLVQPA